MSGAYALTATEEDQDSDQQIFAIAGFALVSLIVFIIIFFTGFANLGFATSSFQREVNNTIAEINALLPPTFRIANSVLGTLENLTTSIYNSLTFLIVEGSQSILNVILTVGNTLVETLQTLLKTMINQLQSLGSQVLEFFQSTFGPITDFVTIAGETVITFCALILSIFSPIITTVNAIVRAIARIGSIF